MENQFSNIINSIFLIGLEIKNDYKVSGFLKIPKTSILVVNSKPNQKLGSNIVYYVDLQRANGDVINAIKTDYSIIQMDYAISIDRIALVNRDKLIIANPYTMVNEFSSQLLNIVSMSLIDKTDYVIVTMDYQITIFDLRQRKIRYSIDKLYTLFEFFILQTSEQVIIASLSTGIQIWQFNLETFVPQYIGYIQNSQKNYTEPYERVFDMHQNLDIIFFSGSYLSVSGVQIINLSKNKQKLLFEISNSIIENFDFNNIFYQIELHDKDYSHSSSILVFKRNATFGNIRDMIFISYADQFIILFVDQIANEKQEFQYNVTDSKTVDNIKPTTQMYALDDTQHFVFGEDQVVNLFYYASGKFSKFLVHYNDGYSRKLSFRQKDVDYAVQIKQQDITVTLVDQSSEYKQVKKLPLPVIQRPNSFLGVKGCIECFVVYTQDPQSQENFIITTLIDPFDSEYLVIPTKGYSNWTETGITSDPYYYDKSVWVIFGYPKKQDDQKFLFILIKLSAQPIYYQLVSKIENENIIKTSYALASVEYKNSLEIIGVGLTGDIFIWNLETKQHKETQFIQNCTNSELGEIFHYNNNKWLILACENRNVVAYNLQNKKSEVQVLQTVASMPRFIKAYSESNLVIVCNKFIGQSFLYRYSKTNDKFTLVISFGRGGLTDLVTYIELINKGSVLWIQYGDCLKDANTCIKCSQENYFLSTENLSEVSSFYGNGQKDHPYTSSYNIVFQILKAQRFQQIFRQIESLDVKMFIDPSQQITLKQSLLNVDFNSIINLTISSANDSQFAQILVNEQLILNAYSSIVLQNLIITFDYSNNLSLYCGFSFTNIKQIAKMDNIKIKLQNIKDTINCYSIKIENIKFSLKKYYLENIDFSKKSGIISIENYGDIEIIDFKLNKCQLGPNFNIIYSDSFYDLVGNTIQIQENKSKSLDSHIISLFTVAQFKISNLDIRKNQFKNLTIFSTMAELEFSNILFQLEQLELHDNTFTISSSHLFFGSFYTLLPKPSHTLILKTLKISNNIYDNQQISDENSFINISTLFETEKIAKITIEDVEFINHHEIQFIHSQEISELTINVFQCLNKDTYNDDKALKNLKSSGCFNVEEVQSMNVKFLNVDNKLIIDQNLINIQNTVLSDTSFIMSNSTFKNLKSHQTLSNSYVNTLLIKCNNKALIQFKSCTFSKIDQQIPQNPLTFSATSLYIINPDGETQIVNSTFEDSNTNSIYGFIYTQSYKLLIDTSTFQRSQFKYINTYVEEDNSQIKQKGGFINALVIILQIFNVSFFQSIAYSGSFLYVEPFESKLQINFRKSNFSEGYSIYDGSAIFIDTTHTDLTLDFQDCNFNDLYTFSQQASAIAIMQNSKKKIKFIGGSIKNIFGKSQNYFLYLINSDLQLQDIKDIQNDIILNISFPIYTTFFFLSSTTVQVQGCVFKNLKQLDESSLLIESEKTKVRIIDSNLENIIFKTNLIFVKDGELNIQNTKFIDIKNKKKLFRILQQNTDVENTENISMIQIIKSKLYITQNSEFQKIQCENNCKGSTFNLKETDFQISDSKFIDSYGQIGGVLFVNGVVRQNNFITSSQFKKNKSDFHGGAIYLKANSNDKFTLKLTKCLFEENVSNQNGGAIFINSDAIVSDGQSIIIKDTPFHKNKAQIGGAIYTQIISPQILDKIEFIGNIAANYGQDIGSYPSKLVLINEKDFSSKNKYERADSNKIVIYDFRSGDSLATLQFQLQNNANEVIIPSVGEDNLVLKYKISKNNNNYIRGQQTANYTKDNIFEFNNAQLIGDPGSFGIIDFVCDKIKILNNDTNKFESSYVFQLEVHFRECQQGEEQNQYNGYQECVFCLDDSYSFDSQECSKCPQGGICKKGQKIQCASGYWREDENSKEIVFCKKSEINCIGGPYGDKVCSEGSIGALCEECDIYGDSWGDSYTKVSRNECVKCSNPTDYYWKMFFGAFWLLISMVFAIRNVEENITQRYLNNILQKYFIRNKNSQKTEEILKDKQSVYVKLLINYIFIISCITSFNLSYPEGLLEFPSFVGKPLSNTTTSLECFLVSIKTEIPLIYLKIFFSLTIPALIITVFTFVKLIYAIKTKRVDWHNISTAAIFLILYIQPDLVIQMISLVSCRKVGESYYVLSNAAYKCYTHQHMKYSRSLVIPILIIWVLIIPLLLFLKLFKNKTKLEKYRFLLTYGFLYKEYKKEAYYWEFVKVILKTAIIMSLNFYSEEIHIKGALVFVAINFYWYLSVKTQPYQEESINQLDIKSTAVSAATIFFALMIYNNEIEYLKYICYSVIIILNVWILYNILKMILVEIIQNVKIFIQSVLELLAPKFKCLKRYQKNNTQFGNEGLNPISCSQRLRLKFRRSFNSYLNLSEQEKKQKLTEMFKRYQRKQVLQRIKNRLKYEVVEDQIELEEIEDKEVQQVQQVSKHKKQSSINKIGKIVEMFKVDKRGSLFEFQEDKLTLEKQNSQKNIKSKTFNLFTENDLKYQKNSDSMLRTETVQSEQNLSKKESTNELNQKELIVFTDQSFED